MGKTRKQELLDCWDAVKTIRLEAEALLTTNGINVETALEEFKNKYFVPIHERARAAVKDTGGINERVIGYITPVLKKRESFWTGIDLCDALQLRIEYVVWNDDKVDSPKKLTSPLPRKKVNSNEEIQKKIDMAKATGQRNANKLESLVRGYFKEEGKTPDNQKLKSMLKTGKRGRSKNQNK
jgi:hypothetical protein